MNGPGRRGGRGGRGRPRRCPYAFRPFAVTGVAAAAASGCRRDRPRPRSGHRVVCSTSALYSLGGYNPERGPGAPAADALPAPDDADAEADESGWSLAKPIFRELWKFNLARRTWRRLPGEETLPEHLASSAVCLAGKTLMAFGGTGAPFGQRCSNSLYTCDISNDEGRFRPTETEGRPPPPQYGQAIVYDRGHLYVTGGTDGHLYTIDVHRLNLRTSVWETVFTCTGNRADEPEARYRHELAFGDRDLYVLGGGTAERAFDFAEIPTFSLETFAWSFRKSKPAPVEGYPPARKCHSAVQIEIGGSLYAFVMGGFDNDSIFDDLWRLEIRTLQWTLMKKSVFPYPLYFHSSAVTPEGCMYTFGGIQRGKDRRSTSRSNRLYKLWLCIPKLSEICWESLLYYFPQIVDADRSKLLEGGVPRHFVDRLEN